MEELTAIANELCPITLGGAVVRLLFCITAAARTRHKPTFDLDCNNIMEIGFFEMLAFQNAGYGSFLQIWSHMIRVLQGLQNPCNIELDLRAQ